MPKYNGHKNWNHWNVILWINNDEGLYNMARNLRRMYPGPVAAREFVSVMREAGHPKTPDGAPYSIAAVTAAMKGLE